MPWRSRILFVLLAVVVWQAEGLLVQLVITSSVIASPAATAITGLKTGAAASGSFLSDSFTFLGGQIEILLTRLPLGVRNAVPSSVFDSIGRGFSAILGWQVWLSLGVWLLWMAAGLIRLLIAINLAGMFCNALRRAGYQLKRAIQLPVRFYAERETAAVASSTGAAPTNGRGVSQRRKEYVEFFSGHIRRIGIILPGGGARGVYQAGALKAIYDFLRDYNALSKVRVIVGTSSGAWNAMFWLSGLMESGGEINLESWWKQQKLSQLVEFPNFWIPFISEHSLSLAPWREQFNALFRDRLDHLFKESATLHFYLTRSDLELGALRYATNWSGFRQRVQTLGMENQENYRLVDVIGPDGFQFQRLTDAVFGSMGQAPLFPGVYNDERCESGDLLEPIPLRFAATVEDCDLVFILPTRAATENLGESRVSRLTRVSHLQQLALEHAAVKHADAINRVAERFDRLEFGATTIAATAGAAGLAAEVASGVREEIDEFLHAYRRLYLFTVCPRDNLEVGTFDYGRERQNAAAFDLMYAQTRDELRHRLFEDIEPEDAHIVTVDGLRTAKGEPTKPVYRRPSQL